MAAAWWYAHNDQAPTSTSAQVTGLLSPNETNKWRVQFDPAPAHASPSLLPQGSSAENMLENVYALLRQGDRSTAIAQTQRLVANFPHFQLGQLLYAELMNEGLAQPIDPK